MLPYSRLERISDVSASQIAMMAASLLLILALTATGLLFLFPDYISAKLSLPKELSQFLLALPILARVGGAGIFLFFTLFLALKKLHRTGVFDRRVSIDKVDVLKGAISTRPTAPLFSMCTLMKSSTSSSKRNTMWSYLRILTVITTALSSSNYVR